MGLAVRKNSSVTKRSASNRLGNWPRSSSDFTYLTADGAKISFVTAKQDENEIKEYQRLKVLKDYTKEKKFMARKS